MTNHNDTPGGRLQHPEDANRRHHHRTPRAGGERPNTVSRLAFKLTPGALFYPSCGSDTYAPLNMFIDSVNAFHFVDHLIIPPLPLLQRENRILLQGIGLAIERQETSEPAGKQNENRNQLLKHPANDEKCFQETWEFLVGGQRRSVEIFRHHCDNLEAFGALEHISVFFYRGDSPGEGGSGQMWTGRELFPQIVAKLTPRALIVTDGANHDLNKEKNHVTPWQPLLDYSAQEDNRDFHYQGRQFVYIGQLDGRRISGIWMVL